jgi:hypothetical protein
VFEDGPLAFEGEFPETQAPAQGIPVIVSLSVVSSLSSRSHIKLAVFASSSYSASRFMRLASD